MRSLNRAIQAAETRCGVPFWQADWFTELNAPHKREKARALTLPGLFDDFETLARCLRYAALLKVAKDSFIGSAVLTATFCACSARSLACAAIVSNWVRV